jgi:hypothetical protein
MVTDEPEPLIFCKRAILSIVFSIFILYRSEVRAKPHIAQKISPEIPAACRQPLRSTGKAEKFSNNFI